DPRQIEANIEDDEAQRDSQEPLDVLALMPMESEHRIACDSGESTEIESQAAGAYGQRGPRESKRPSWVLVAELRKKHCDSGAQERHACHEPGKRQQQCRSGASEQQQEAVSVPEHVE